METVVLTNSCSLFHHSLKVSLSSSTPSLSLSGTGSSVPKIVIPLFAMHSLSYIAHQNSHCIVQLGVHCGQGSRNFGDRGSLASLSFYSRTTILSSLSFCFSKMESSKAGGKRSVKDRMKEEVVEEEKEEEEDEDVVGFGSGEDDKKKKVYNRKGSSGGGSTLPSCQVDNCTTDMTYARPYHRRHKVCELHAKVPVVVVARLRQRFCQQCSRFHELPEFDETKRSCRRRLVGHNERRRKSSHDTHGEGSG